VLTTIAILMVMAWSNSLAMKSIEQTKQLEKSRIRPYLSLTIKIILKGNAKNHAGSPYGYLFLNNTGLTQAYNIQINMTPQIASKSLIGGKQINKVPYFVANSTPYLAPGGNISDDLGFLPNIYEIFDTPIFKGFIKYFDSHGEEYKENFKFDFTIMDNACPYIQENA